MTFADCEGMTRSLTTEERKSFIQAKKDGYLITSSRKEELQVLWLNWCSLAEIPFIYARNKEVLYKITLIVGASQGRITGAYQWMILDYLKSLKFKMPATPDLATVTLTKPFHCYVPAAKHLEVVTAIAKICAPALQHTEAIPVPVEREEPPAPSPESEGIGLIEFAEDAVRLPPAPVNPNEALPRGHAAAPEATASGRVP